MYDRIARITRYKIVILRPYYANYVVQNSTRSILARTTPFSLEKLMQLLFLNYAKYASYTDNYCSQNYADFCKIYAISIGKNQYNYFELRELVDFH